MLELPVALIFSFIAATILAVFLPLLLIGPNKRKIRYAYIQEHFIQYVQGMK